MKAKLIYVYYFVQINTKCIYKTKINYFKCYKCIYLSEQYKVQYEKKDAYF